MQVILPRSSSEEAPNIGARWPTHVLYVEQSFIYCIISELVKCFRFAHNRALQRFLGTILLVKARVFFCHRLPVLTKLKRFGMQEANPTPTPLNDKEAEEPLDGKTAADANKDYQLELS